MNFVSDGRKLDDRLRLSLRIVLDSMRLHLKYEDGIGSN